LSILSCTYLFPFFSENSWLTCDRFSSLATLFPSSRVTTLSLCPAAKFWLGLGVRRNWSQLPVSLIRLVLGREGGFCLNMWAWNDSILSISFGWARLGFFQWYISFMLLETRVSISFGI
jgi:hypothetical protein